MKQSIFLAVIVATLSCNTGQGDKLFTAEGSIKNTAAKMVYLEEVKPDAPPMIMDSFALKTDGGFSVKAPSKEESLYQLRLQGSVVPFARFINDVANLKLTGDLTNMVQPYTVTGSPASVALIEFEKTIYSQGQQAIAAQNALDSCRKAAVGDSIVTAYYAKVQAGINGMKVYAQDFFTTSKSPILTLYTLSSFQNTMANLGIKGFTQVEMGDIITKAANRFPNHAALKTISQGFAGKQAPDFTQPDVNGQPVSLFSFKGKYVLVDFWASWCKPCRLENPNVVKTYNEFKDKNFTVLGVSLDQNKDAWLKAIQQDGLTWTQVSDLNFWSNAAAVLYEVRSIPSNVLIDPKGDIIARNLSGEELAVMLRSLLK